MGRKNVLFPYQLVDDADLSDDFVSDPVHIRYLDNVAIQINAGGAPEGSFSLEATVDGETWIAFSSASEVTGAPSNFLYDLNQLSFDQVRVRYTFTSGTGTADIWVMAKQVGG